MLKNAFDFTDEKLCSIEVSSKRNLDYDILETMKFSFISVIWMGKYTEDPPLTKPLMSSRNLIGRGYSVLLHIPSRCFSTNSAFRYLNYAKKIGVRNLLCIRGGRPEALDPQEVHFPYAIDIIRFITKKFGEHFEIAVVGYPMCHPESEDQTRELEYLKKKIKAGAKYILTQYTFCYENLMNYYEQLKLNGIKAKIIPGVHICSSYADFVIQQRICRLPEDDCFAKFVKDHPKEDNLIFREGKKKAMNFVRKVLANDKLLPPHLFTMNELHIIKSFLLEMQSDTNELKQP